MYVHFHFLIRADFVADWQLWVAATVSKDLRDMMLAAFVRYVNETPSSNPLPDVFNQDTGANIPGLEFRARPVMGGSFALLMGAPTGALARKLGGLPEKPFRPSYYKNLHYK
jgi:Domain of unknown function (DUF1793)